MPAHLEEGLATLERLGGRSLSDTITVPNIGRFRVVQDPQGAVFALFEAAFAPPADAAPEIGDVSWHELYTTDADAALAFYTELFGWTLSSAMDMGPMGQYYIFGRNGRDLGGMMNTPPEMAHVPPNWNLYVQVSDVREGAARITANGGQVLNGPMEVPGGDQIVNGLDPQGGAFSLHAKER